MCPFTSRKTQTSDPSPAPPATIPWQAQLNSLSSTRIRGIVIGLILSLALGLVPLTLLLVKQELIDRAGEIVALGAADIADKLDIVLAERLGDIQAFARSPLLTHNSPEHITGYLEHLKQLYPMYERLSVANAEGRVVASTDPTLLNQSWQSEPWFTAISHSPQPHAGIVRQQGRPNGVLRSVRFAVQLRAPQGGWQGAIVTDVDERIWRAFVTQTTQRSSRPTSQPEIIEFTVLSKDGEILLTSIPLSEATSTENQAGWTSTLLADQRPSGYVEEIDALTGYARMVGLPRGDDFRWSILVTANRDAVLQSIWTLLWKLIGIGSACLLPLLGLFSWSWRRQMRDEAHANIARRALEANEARIRKVVDIALDAVITIDEQGIVTGWNPHAEQIFGWKSDEMIGQSLTTTIIPPQYREAHEHGLRHYTASGTGPVLNQRIEITALDRSGREFPIELAITPMHLDGRTIFSAFLRDITERKQAEDTLRRSQAAAESANRAKTEFLANMSHEIRTPLNAIVGTSDVLLKTALTPDQRQCALMSQRAGQALLRLVNDVLDVAKIEAGTLRIESAPFDLLELLERTKRFMELRQYKKDVALSVAVAPDIPPCLDGDGFRLQQILFNLIENALKFTEQGSVSIAVSSANADAQRLRLQFTIRDTGIGIPADQQAHIFDRFTQVDSGDSRKYGGTGLGLSICKQLTQLMQGTIHVTSEIGKGSAFTVIIPFTVAPTTATAAALTGQPPLLHSTPGDSTDTPLSSPLTILLIDDSPEIGQLARLYLKAFPYRLELASDGPTAVQQYQARRYDLIFLDLQMPGMDGYATAKAIRDWEDAQGIAHKPMIAVTADVLGPARERSQQAGCTGFIEKPFSQTTFLEAIQQYVHPVNHPSAHKHSAQMTSTSPPPHEQDLDRLRQKFLSNRWRDLEALSSATATCDWATIQTIGHRIKGLAGSYGFDTIGEVGSVIEQSAERQEMNRVAAGIQELAQALEQLDPSHDRAA